MILNCLEKKDSILVYKLNIDDNPNTPQKYGVRGIPTLLLFKDGRLVDQKVGSLPKTAIVEWIESNLNIDAKILFDASNPLKQRIQLLSKNGIIGFLLVLLFLTMFLHPRVSFWVALSIPISFLGMFFFSSFGTYYY